VAVIDHAGRVVRQLELPNQDSGYVRLRTPKSQHRRLNLALGGNRRKRHDPAQISTVGSLDGVGAADAKRHD
jgi:hypothetical protein